VKTLTPCREREGMRGERRRERFVEEGEKKEGSLETISQRL
jgi:hypothetical protein